MRKLMAVVALVAALFVSAATPSHADEKFISNCGSGGGGHHASAAYIDHTIGSTAWPINVQANCGYQGTFEWEIQWSSDNAHWNDATSTAGEPVDHSTITSQADADVLTTYFFQPLITCVNTRIWRLKVWDAGTPSVKYLWPDGSGGGNRGC